MALTTTTTTTSPDNTTPKIRRVVSSFLLTTTTTDADDENDATTLLRVAVFHRKDTMPTFPSHWAVISGSIEEGETPWETARRELYEETNLEQIMNNNPSALLFQHHLQHGLYVDVPYYNKRRRSRTQQHQDDSSDASSAENDDTIEEEQQLVSTIIRVYPFVVRLTPAQAQQVEMRGTEHDRFQWISVPQLLKGDDEQTTPMVPALATAFLHATCGKYNHELLTPAAQSWAADQVSGATTMAVNAIDLVRRGEALPSQLSMLRPSMVVITNILQYLEEQLQMNVDISLAATRALEALQQEATRALELAVQRILAHIQDWNNKSSHDDDSTRCCYTIAVFSRSSTLVSILKRVRDSEPSLAIVCSQSTPGDEGILMAQDLAADDSMSSTTTHVPDDVLIDQVTRGEIDMILVGCDCIMADSVINKVGTAKLARAAKESSHAKVLCCSDRWKIWEDVFPPPLEEDIFESIPRSLLDEIIVPEPQCDENNNNLIVDSSKL